jgi:replicative superfamily II helicase
MPAKPKSISKRTVYLDSAPDVQQMLDRACRTRVFSYLCVEALREWLNKNGFSKTNQQ